MRFWVPGRIEFLGKHTDYAGGRSLLCALERGIKVEARPRSDALVRVYDRRLRQRVECPIDPSLDRSPGGWSTYVHAVARRISRDFPMARRGVDIELESDLPMASGMSSSSALVIAVYLAVATANHLDALDSYRQNIATPEDLAEYLGAIESGASYRAFTGDHGVGTLSGCEDQTTMICARPGHLVRYSFCPVRFEEVIPLPSGYRFVVAASGVVAEKTAAALEKYNALSRFARAAAEAWRLESRRADATLGDAVRHAGEETIREAIARRPVPPFTARELVERFDHFYMESEIIIPAVADSLRRGDLTSLGALIDRSQANAERLLGNQVPETVMLARSARELGAPAASAFGAGFGGSVWALVADEGVEHFVEAWRSRYLTAFPDHVHAAEFFATAAGGPAARLE